MLLESALEELSIDLELDLNQQTCLPPPPPTPYIDRVVIEMCSPSDSWSDQRSPPSAMPKTQAQSSVPNSSDMAQEISFKTPGSVPFGWEIHPGVPKPEITEIECDQDEDSIQSEYQSPLRLPPSAYSSSPSPINSRSRRGYFTWNISPGRRHLGLAASLHMHSLSVGDEYDGDDESVELDSNEECSPVSTLETPGSPRIIASPSNKNKQCPQHLEIEGVKISQHKVDPAANLASAESSSSSASCSVRSCATLLWGIFPCSSKCFLLPFSKNREKAKQAAGLNKESSLSGDDKGAVKGVPSALKKKSSGSSSWGGTKQVRFTVEVDEDEGAAAGHGNSMEWASYGLF